MFERGRERAEDAGRALSTRVEQARSRRRAWGAAHPREVLILGIGLVAAGAALIYLAIEAKLTIVGLAGMVAAVAGLRCVNFRIRLQTDLPRWWLAVAVLGVAVGGATVVVGMNGRSAPVAALGVLVALVCVLPVTDALRRWSEPSPDGSPTVGARRLIPGGLAAMVLGVIGARWVPVPVMVLLVGGLLAYKVGLRRASNSPQWARLEAWVGGAASVAGAAGMVAATVFDKAWLGAVAAAAFFLGLVALSVGWPKAGLRPFTRRAAIGVGGAAMVAGGLVARAALTLTPGATLVFALVVGALGASFVWRGEALFVGVLVGTALVWLSVDRIDPAPNLHPESAKRILALGDSYISGEGAPHFVEGTNVADENQCRRSVTAYPYLVADAMDMGIDFYACSGAKAKELYVDRQQPKSPPDVAGGLPQLDNPIDASRIGLVLVSIGGNDAQFGDIVQGCVIPGTCDALRDLWLTNLDQIGDDIVTALTRIKERVPNVPVVVMPYPLMLENHGCDWSRLDDREHDFISQFILILDDRVRVAAQKAGVHFFADGMFAFENARICGGEPERTVTNFINVNPVEGTFADRISPRNWIHGSFHPKPSGHRLTAAALVAWLDKTLPTLDPAHPNPAPDPEAAFAYPNTGGTKPVLVPERDRVIDAACGLGAAQVEPFGTTVRLYEEDLPYPLVVGADSRVCIQQRDESWVSVQPTEDKNLDAYLEDGIVFVKPPREARPVLQRVVFTGTDGRRQLRLVSFCVTSDCPDSFNHYFQDQLGLAADVVVPPVLLIIVGGWFVAAGTTQPNRRRWRGRPDREGPAAAEAPPI